MLAGAAQIDITPSPGVELSGFAARRQPSTAVLDPLFARGLYLEQDGEKLLWLHGDLVGLERAFVQELRERVGNQLGIVPGRILVSATHTHSGPSTIHLNEAGKYDPPYMAWLAIRMAEVAAKAMAAPQECELVAVEGRSDLAVDRRRKASAHTDPRVAAVGWRRKDGRFVAAVANYAMHAVCLGSTNRRISADWPGWTARALAEQLPGPPIVLVTNGACGNLNPPAENIDTNQLQAWGRQVAAAVAAPLGLAAAKPEPPLRIASCMVPVPMDTLDVAGINAYADHALLDPAGLGEWGDKYRRAIAAWRQAMTDAVAAGPAPATQEMELFGVRVGDLVFVAVGAEMFSIFTDHVREQTDRPVYTIGYANGDMGYVPADAAYEEGGYEVTSAHLFYNSFRVKRGGLELLTQRAAELVNSLV